MNMYRMSLASACGTDAGETDGASCFLSQMLYNVLFFCGSWMQPRV